MLDVFFAAPAWAQDAAPAADGFGGFLSGPIPMLVLMFAVFYFLLIRPQQRKAKAHREMLGALKVGDQVMTSGGILGRITGLDESVVVLEIAPQVRMKVNRGHIAGGGAQAPGGPSINKK